MKRTECVIVNPSDILIKDDVFLKELTKKYVSTGVPISIEEGYVETIYDIKPIDNLIDYDGNIVYKLEFSYTCYIPVVGSISDAKVCIITEKALLVDVRNILKVIIPRYDKSKGYKKGDTISIKITAIEIRNNAYNCVGSVI
jgi:DNA-directed RNA polymerase subunit E'/Rpb7